jgi:hypothetical protein
LLALSSVYFRIATWEPPDWDRADATEEAIFREMVEADQLYDFVEQTKHRVLQSGLVIPDRWLWPMGKIRAGQGVSDKERHEILQIATEMLCRLPRLHPDAQPKNGTRADDSGNMKDGTARTQPYLDADDVKILESLARRNGILAYQAEIIEVNRDRASERLRYLASIGYVTNPEGKKRGWLITDAGMERLKNLPAV